MESFCPACDRGVDDFEVGLRGRPRAKCPNCDALERHRLVALLLRAHQPVLAQARTVLDVAPHGPNRRSILSMTGGRYIGLDIDTRTGPSVLGSITELPFATGSMDVILCMHVLEHIGDDETAIRELARVLTTTGIAFVQVPRRSGQLTDEDPDAPAAERVSRFGQADHVRVYGDDFERRLYAAGLFPAAVYAEMFLSREDVYRFGLQPREHLWICRTQRTESDHFPTRTETERRLAQEMARRRRLELDPPVRIVRGLQRRLRRLRRSRTP